MFEESYSVKAGGFEGPLELLLDLIEKRKLHISDVSLSQVTDDFIGFLREREHFPLGLSAQFVLIASTLLLIKSKSLLPTIDLTPEEEASIEDLEARLKEYRRIQELSAHVKSLFGKRIIFQRLENRRRPVVFTPDGNMTIGNIALAAQAVIANFPKKEVRPEVSVKTVVTLEETIENLTRRIGESLRMSFKDFSGHGGQASQSREERVEVIVGFLAMLELAKQGIIALSQEGLFNDIHMETEVVGVPRYE